MKINLNLDSREIEFGNSLRPALRGYFSVDWFNIYQGTAFAIGKKIYIKSKGWQTEGGFE